MFSGQINLYEWVIIILLPLTVWALIKTWLLKSENRRLNDKLKVNDEYLKKLEDDWAELTREYDRINEFQNSLDEAELTTRLQQPRLQAKDINSSPVTPEKYTYIRSLHEKGMDAEEIASILGISALEAEQLVALSRIAREKETPETL